MPLPSPKGKEKQSDFVSRCMGDNTMGKDFKDQKQRAAVCYSQWKKAKASADVVLGSDGNEVLIFNKVAQEKYSPKQSVTKASEESLEEYKMDFYHMSLGSLNSIKKHAENIIAAIDNPMVKENLTEPWLQGKIAITEDYMLAIHNYIMFVEENKAEAKEALAKKIVSSEGEYECEDCGYEGEKAEKCPKCGSSNYKEDIEDEDEMEDEDDTEVDASGEDLNEYNFYCPEESEYVTAEEVAFNEEEVVEYDIAMKRPGLWENIRRKKKREGKNYKPAKPGDEDRPSKDAWKKAQGTEYQGRKVKLNKPFRTPDGPKKFSVYVKNEKGNVVKVNFGDPNMKIKKNIPARRKSFRARHNCESPGPKWKARYWACKSW
jgi:hypothetical protein